jgi:hypothetical protein
VLFCIRFSCHKAVPDMFNTCLPFTSIGHILTIIYFPPDPGTREAEEGREVCPQGEGQVEEEGPSEGEPPRA